MVYWPNLYMSLGRNFSSDLSFVSDRHKKLKETDDYLLQHLYYIRSTAERFYHAEDLMNYFLKGNNKGICIRLTTMNSFIKKVQWFVDVRHEGFYSTAFQRLILVVMLCFFDTHSM